MVVEDDRIGLGELGQDRVRAGPEAAGQPFQLAAGRRLPDPGELGQGRLMHLPGRAGQVAGTGLR